MALVPLLLPRLALRLGLLAKQDLAHLPEPGRIEQVQSHVGGQVAARRHDVAPLPQKLKHVQGPVVGRGPPEHNARHEEEEEPDPLLMVANTRALCVSMCDVRLPLVTKTAQREGGGVTARDAHRKKETLCRSPLVQRKFLFAKAENGRHVERRAVTATVSTMSARLDVRAFLVRGRPHRTQTLANGSLPTRQEPTNQHATFACVGDPSAPRR